MEVSGHKPRQHAFDVAMWMIVPIALFALGFPQIGAAAGETVPTFTKDVAPIVFQHCVSCHRAGALASNVPLISFDTVQPRAELIKKKVMAREMPPWPADPNKSVKFRNDPRLSRQDIDTLVAWVNGGTPKGNDADLPPIPKFEGGWMHPRGLKPDLVVSLPQLVQVPATGELPYLRLVVKVPSSEDRWIAASQTRPGNSALVHHMAITETALAGGVSPANLDQLVAVARRMGLSDTMFTRPAVTARSSPEVFDMLGVYTPGTTIEMLPEGTAKLLKAGKNMYLNFNIHYKTIGESGTDRSMIALWFQPGPPKHQLFRVPGAGDTIIANGMELLTDAPGTRAEGTQVAIPPIPPYVKAYEVTGITGYLEPVTIYQFQPHAHYHGRDFTYTVVYPDGREQTVLSVPKYDHRWQMAYELETPLKLPAGSKLVVTAHYDNSTKNVHGSLPVKEVYFRDQNTTLDEMFSPFIQYSLDRRDPTKPASVMQVQDWDDTTNTFHHQELLKIGEVVGCLEARSPGDWMLIHASDPTLSETRATTSVALKAAEIKPLGGRRYRLLGAGVFNPSGHRGEKVAVKGILIKDLNNIRINATSLQRVATSCVR